LGLIVPELPYNLCLTENHLKEQETESFSIDHYTFGAKFGRKILKKRRYKYFCTWICNIHQY